MTDADHPLTNPQVRDLVERWRADLEAAVNAGVDEELAVEALFALGYGMVLVREGERATALRLHALASSCIERIVRAEQEARTKRLTGRLN